MKKAILIIVTFLLVGIYSATSNDVYIDAAGGYASHDMKSMKDFMGLIDQGFIVDGRLTDNFPGYYYLKFAVRYEISETASGGIFLKTNSTGGRFSYKDYSGEYRFDSKIRALTIGANYTLQKEFFSRFFAGFFADVGWCMTTLTMDERLAVGENVTAGAIDYDAGSLLLIPGVLARYELMPSIGLSAGFELAYCIDTEGKYDGPGITYFQSKGFAGKSEWQGLRTGVFLSLSPTKLLTSYGK